MADGTPDFADLLAAFDDGPVVTLHQISSGLGPSLAQTHPSFPQVDQTHENQLGQIVGLNQNTGLQSQTFEPSELQPSAQVEDAFGGGGSLGSMFLSSVESMLSETGPSPLGIPQPATQPKPAQRKSRPPRPKQNSTQQNRFVGLQHNRALQNTNVAFAPANVEGGIPLQSTMLSTNSLGMKMPGSLLPFGVAGLEMQQGSAAMPTAAQQKIHQGQFIQRTQGARQQPQSSNPPRPLSAASSTSEHHSRPGSVPQPSPSCGSNHSGDPATPLTPQSYNAGTPQSYNAGTPQSYNAGTPQSYKPATPLQIYPVSGQPQRQRPSGYADTHQQQQISAGIHAGASESFVPNQRANLTFRSQPSPLHPASTASETLSDLPSPLKEAFITPNNPGPFSLQPSLPNSQLWNQGPAVMAPSALFTSTAHSKDATVGHFNPSDTQMSYGYGDVYGMQTQHPFAMQRQESNARSESLTSKQNELLDQMPLIEKTKKAQQLQNATLNSSLSSVATEKYPDIGISDTALGKHSEGGSTMSMMDKANNAGSAVVKELLGTPYEAISPVSDYNMSPVHKSSLHDDLSESITFLTPKLSSDSGLSIPHDSNPMTDPVLMYLKHDDGKATSENNNSNSVSLPDINPSLPEIQHTWSTQRSTANTVPSSLVQPLFFSSGASASPLANATLFSSETNHPSGTMPGAAQNSSMVSKGLYPLPVMQMDLSSQRSRSQVHGGAKNPQSSPAKQKGLSSPPVSKNAEKPFGITRRKASTDKSKQLGSLKAKKTTSIDSNFGFESDDETEPTICLSKVSPKAKKSAKVLQPSLISPKTRAVVHCPSKDLTDKMEHLKQLQKQQQEMMHQLQRLQAQGSVSSQAANVTVSMHSSVQAPMAKLPQYTESFYRPSVEKSIVSFAAQPSHNFAPMLFSKPNTKTPPFAPGENTNLDFPAPLSLTQPTVTPRFSGLSKAHLVTPSMPPGLEFISNGAAQTSLPSSNAQIPNFVGFLNTSTTVSAALCQPGLPFTSSHPLYASPHIPPGSTVVSSASVGILSQELMSSNSSLPSPASATEVPTNASRVAPNYPPTTSIHNPALHSTNPITSDITFTPPTITTASSVRPQPFDNHFNLDWLHRESETVLSGKFRTPESASEVANSSPRNVSLPVTDANTELATLAVATASKYPTRVLPEEDIIPLKQSIHTVHHLDISKSQPAPSVPAATASVTVAAKESAPILSETKHLNFKKHRILEGYPKENYKTTFNSISTGPTQLNTPAARSVLDKQRRYSKERNSVKPRHRVQHHVTHSPKLIAPMSGSQTPVPQAARPGPSATPNKDKPQSNEAKPASSENEEKKDKTKDDQAGNMLLLFNSLLQEASESAADSLKTTLGTKQDVKTTKDDECKISSPTPATSNPPVVASEAPKETQRKSNLPVSGAVTNSTEQPAIHQNMLPNKPAKKNRPAATVPFKRRPYPAFDDTSTSVTTFSNPVFSAASVLPSTITVSSTTPNSVSVSTTLSKSVCTPSVTVSSQVAMPAESTSVVDSVVMRAAATTPPAPSVMPEKAPQTSSAVPKLRITLFRSSKGKVLHQAAVIGAGNDTETVDSEGSSHRKQHKRKKKKRKRRTSSSDNASVSSKSSAIDETAKLAQKAKLNELITKELEKKAQSILRSVEASTAIASPSPEAPVPVKESEEIPIKPQRRKRMKANTMDNMEGKKTAKRAKVSKPSAKKKQVAKSDEPIVRYQPKSALQASIAKTSAATTPKSAVSMPVSFRRAPGKRPLYLSASEAKSTAVPTIQLVARNTKLLGNVEQKASASAKVVSVKITNSLPSKSLSPQVLPSSGVHYIIPSTRGQKRILLPNISSSSLVTAPVSIVSPRFARSFSGGFVPMSMCALTSAHPASTKPQLFSVPLSHADGLPNTIKLITSKHLDTSKTQKADVFVRKITTSSQARLETFKLSTTTQSSKVTVTRTLSTPRVTTKIISPAASTQMTSNMFQSTFLKLISSQNPVSTYEPPSPPSDIELDPSMRKQFQCLECKDTFMFSKTLDDHYKRRCILIKVRCMQCDKDLVFLNKCKLLLHARQHSEKGGNGMQFNNAHISPLPLSLCKPQSKKSYLDKDDNSAAAERQSEEETSKISVGVPASFPTVLACTDCKFIGSNPEALEEHFQRVASPPTSDKLNGAKPATSFACELCSVSVPNQCSFMAHMRMHKRATPHTCPECGQTFDNDGLQEHAYSESRREIDFNLHLSVQCFHLSRLSAYKCRICNSIFKNAELLRRHLEVRHLQTFYKCRDCPMAFKTQDTIASHQRTAHGVVAVTKMIHKCPLCDTVFTDNSPTQQLFLLQKHFEGHMSHPSINITAYKCLFCNNIYERKADVRDHLKSAHDVGDSAGGGAELSTELGESGVVGSEEKADGTRKRPPEQSVLKEPPQKVSRQRPDGAAAASMSNLLIASGILANRDSRSTPDLPVTKNAMQPLKLRLKGMSAHPANGAACSDALLDSDPDMTSANAGVIIRDGRKFYPCGECSRELPSASARLNHVKMKHKGIRTMFCCPHCPPGKIQFAKKITLKKHLKKVHQIEDIKKQDVLIEYVKLPVGQRFDPMMMYPDNDDPRDSQQSPKGASHPMSSKVRKKVTGPGRRLNRPIRHVRRDLENGSPYIENSDSEVEQIMSNRKTEDSATERSDNEEPDFSLLKLPDLYTCANCDYECNDRLEFQAHIIEHKEETECEGIQNTMQQCTECGLRFASVASHTKHLFIKHKVKKKKLLDLYDRRLKAERAANGSLPGLFSGDASNGRSTLSSDKKKHKCTVCFKRFEDDSRLRTHMRTHGLAFVKSKHAS